MTLTQQTNKMSTTTLAERPNKTSALGVMASRFNVEPDKLLSTLKNTVFKGASNDELLALVVVANEYGLNPLTKEIYAFPAKGGGIVPVVSVDGWIRIINDHAQMDGIEFEWESEAKSKEPISCTAIIHRKDRKHPTKVTEYLSECRRNTEPWKMTHRMLRHKALIQGGRVAFGFGGIYDEDEARDIASRSVGAIKVERAKPVFSYPTPIEDTKDTEDNFQSEDPIADDPAPDFQLEEGKPTPQEQIRINLRDQDIDEVKLLKWIAKTSKIKIGGVSELTIEHADEILSNWEAISEEVEAAK